MPFSAYAQGLVWAVAIWHRESGWSWRRIQAWLADHGLPVHLRTLQRWSQRWGPRMAACLQNLVVWLGETGFHQVLDVWGRLDARSAFRSWRQLWRGVQAHAPAWRRGAMWVGPTLLGLAGHTECRMARAPTAAVG